MLHAQIMQDRNNFRSCPGAICMYVSQVGIDLHFVFTSTTYKTRLVIKNNSIIK